MGISFFKAFIWSIILAHLFAFYGFINSQELHHSSYTQLSIKSINESSRFNSTSLLSIPKLYDGSSFRDSSRTLLTRVRRSSPIFQSRKWYEAPKVASEELHKNLLISHNEVKNVRCPARGNPLPTIHWFVNSPNDSGLLVSSKAVTRHPGWNFQQVGEDLRFPAIENGATISDFSLLRFYCQASNILGVARSVEFAVERVPSFSNLNITYVTEEVLEGSTARVSCSLSPESAKPYFEFKFWELIMGHKPLQRIEESNSKYRVIRETADNPEIYILHVTEEEFQSLHLRCMFSPKMLSHGQSPAIQHYPPTGVRLKRGPAKGSIQRPATHFKPLDVTLGKTVELPCYMSNHRGPISWYVYSTDSGGSESREVEFTSNKFAMMPREGGNLIINSVDASVAGRYSCWLGRYKHDVEIAYSISVYVDLSATLEPSQLSVRLNDTVELTCRVGGDPRSQIEWLFNGRPLQPRGDAHFSRVEPEAFSATQRFIIRRMRMEHVGTYQCLVYNYDPRKKQSGKRNNAIATATILIQDMKPMLKSQSPPQNQAHIQLSRTSPSADLTCHFYGHPAPSITWFLDDAKVPLEMGEMPQIGAPNMPTDGTAPEMAYVVEAKMFLDLTKFPDSSTWWQYGGEYKAIAGRKKTSENGVSSEVSVEDSSTVCRFLVMIGSLRIRPKTSEPQRCQAGGTCVLTCYAVAFQPVQFEWYRYPSQHRGPGEDRPKRIPVDHREEVFNGGRSMLIRDADVEHNGTYECVATAANERLRVNITLLIAFAPKVSDFPSHFQAKEGESSLSYLCSSRVVAEKPWFAWWEFHPANKSQPVQRLCRNGAVPGFEVTMLEPEAPQPAFEMWMKHLPCMDSARDWLRFANRVPTFNIRPLRQAEHSGMFFCFIQNSVGMDSRSVNITFIPEFEFSVKPPNKLPVVLGDSVTIDCQAMATNPLPTVQWRYTASDGTRKDVPLLLDVKNPSEPHGFGQLVNGSLHFWNVGENVPKNYFCFLLPPASGRGLMSKEKSTAVNMEVNIPVQIRPMEHTVEVQKHSAFNLTCTVRGDLENLHIHWLMQTLSGDGGGGGGGSNGILHKVHLKTRCDMNEKATQVSQAGVGGSVASWVRNWHSNCLPSSSSSSSSSSGEGEQTLDVTNMRQFLVMSADGKIVENRLHFHSIDDREATEYTCQAWNHYNRNNEKKTAFVQLVVVAPPEPVRVNHEQVQVKERSAVLVWQAPLVTGGKPLLRYQISYFITEKKEEREMQKVVAVPPTNTSTEVSPLRPYTKYTFLVSAVNQVGSSEPVVLHLTTLSAAPDGGVMNLTGKSFTSETITVNWQPPMLHLRNGIITGYQLCYMRKGEDSSASSSSSTGSVSGSVWNEESRRSTCVTLPATVNQYEIINLPKFTPYTIRITAINEKGTSPPQFVSARTLEDLPQAPPREVRCVSGVDQIRVEWRPPDQNTLNGVLLGYLVTYFAANPLGDESEREECIVQRATHCVLRSLRAFSNYSISVRSQNSKGVSPTAAQLTCATLEGAPGKVRQLKGVSSANGSCLYLSWLPPENVNGRVRDYCVYVKEAQSQIEAAANNVGRGCLPPLDSVQQWRLVCGLRSGHEYMASVRAQTVYAGEDTNLARVVKVRSTMEENIISIGYALEVPSRTTVDLDCLTTHSLPSQVYWTFSNGDISERHFKNNSLLRLVEVGEQENGVFTCRTTVDAISYNLSVSDTTTGTIPRAPRWRNASENLHGIQISWTSGGATSASVSQFEVQWHNLANNVTGSSVLRGDARNFYLHPVPCASSVRFKLRAKTESGGWGGWSEEKNFHTVGSAPVESRDWQELEKAAERSGLAVGPNWRYVNFTRLLLPGNGCAPEWYQVVVVPSRGGRWQLEEESVENAVFSRTLISEEMENQCCLNVTSLHPNSGYHVRVRGKNSAGLATVVYHITTLPPYSKVEPITQTTGRPSQTSELATFTVLVTLGVGLIIVIIAAVGLLLYAQRHCFLKEGVDEGLQQQQEEPLPPSGPPPGEGGRVVPPTRNYPLPPQPQLSVHSGSGGPVYSRGNSTDPALMYPANQARRLQDFPSYNSEVVDIEPYAVYQPATMARLQHQYSYADQPTLTRQTSSVSGQVRLQHSNGTLMRPTRLLREGMAALRVEEEERGTPSGRRSSSLDCIHQVGITVAPPTMTLVRPTAAPVATEPVYRGYGGNSTVSSNQEELALAYESNILQGGPTRLPMRPGLAPRAAPPPQGNNDSSGSSTDPGIREFTQQPPVQQFPHQPMVQQFIHQPAGPYPTRGHDPTEAYESVESVAYYPSGHPATLHRSRMLPQPTLQPQYMGHPQRLLSANEEWGEPVIPLIRAPTQRMVREPSHQSGTSNTLSGKVHPRDIAAARGETRYHPQQAALHPSERRPLLESSSSTAYPPVVFAGGAPSWGSPSNRPLLAPIPPVGNEPSPEEENPYTPNFTMV